MNNRDQQLKIEIVDGILSISIGVDMLINAVKYSNYFSNFSEEPEITNADVFIQAIVDSLLAEEEDGTTLVHRMLDKAAEEAIEDGCEGIEFED